ncbi:MAG: HTTM domain-containing protein [Deltaproteobacteria bacterium]|jgi:vitamin K-dependent gamma-carboxylase
MTERRLGERWTAPVDIASIAALRILFGVMMCAGLVRFMASGWIEIVYVEPSFFFKYPGFEWVRVWGPTGLYLHHAVLAVLALCVALGLYYRFSIVAFGLGWTYVQLMDQTNYLNHYYLVFLLCGLLAVLPAHAAFSIDARRRPELRRSTVPRWMVSLLRFQVGVVYFYAALAKLNADWLLHAQPLNIWLSSRTDLPFIGSWLGKLWVAYLLSWVGFLYDLTIPLWLSIRRTRGLAYLAVLGFHAMTQVFFDIGMFPTIMIVATTIFFDPSWPRRILRNAPSFAEAPTPRPGRLATAIVVAYCAFQVAVPLRHYLLDGDVLWNERGMRWSWKVMVREKNGAVTYHVRNTLTDRRWQVTPHRYLAWRQVSEMSSQPDMILQLGQHVAADFERRGLGPVEVRAEALVSLNGRRSQLLVDPAIDVRRVGHDVPYAAWLMPGPTGAPVQLTAHH